jgi:peptidase E
MGLKKGKIAIIGSGEFTSSMVTVHKELIDKMGGQVRAVFLDTPAGFQPNVDQISKRVCEYFEKQIKQPMSIASFKSSDDIDPYEMEEAFRRLMDANYIVIGPGSPTYALRHWKRSHVPQILIKKIEGGSCLVAASAAALTIGCLTLPVYEIYKVGEPLHWLDGMNILGHFGLNLVVIPHWNNAEGGSHDTRFCYMGESRFQRLESMIPKDLQILGIDEHTALILDFERDMAKVMGIGNVTIRFKGIEKSFKRGEQFGFHELRTPSHSLKGELNVHSEELASNAHVLKKENTFWERIHLLEDQLSRSLENKDIKGATNAILDLDRLIWEAQKDFESEEFISQARELLRESIILLSLSCRPSDREEELVRVVNSILDLRESMRKQGEWRIADMIRDALLRSGIRVEDTGKGPSWKLNKHF